LRDEEATLREVTEHMGAGRGAQKEVLLRVAIIGNKTKLRLDVGDTPIPRYLAAPSSKNRTSRRC
jgi:hypothetical protein